MDRVRLTPSAFTDLSAIGNPIHRRIVGLIARLERWPDVSGVKPLSGNLAGHWRLRTGDYRLQFRVEGDRIIVEKIGHRRDFYE